MRPAYILIFILTLICCKKTSDRPSIGSDRPSIWVNATVFTTRDISCGTPVLNFYEDSIKVRAFMADTGISGHFLNYVVREFPAAINIQGKKVLVQISRLKPGEFFICNHLGISWSALKVLDAKPR